MLNQQKQKKENPLRLNFTISATIILFAMFVLFSGRAYGQLTGNTVFLEGAVNVGKVFNKTCVLSGIRGGWWFTKNFSVGFAYHDVATTILLDNVIDPVTERFFIQSNYGGLEFGARTALSKTLTLQAFFLCAGGGYNFVNENKNSVYQDVFGLDYLAWEPQLRLQYALTDIIKLSAGISNRFITDNKAYKSAATKLMKGFTAGISLSIESL